MTGPEMILLGIRIANAIVAGVPGAIEASNLVARMVAEGREPTDAEWDQLNAATAGYRDRLHGSGAGGGV